MTREPGRVDGEPSAGVDADTDAGSTGTGTGNGGGNGTGTGSRWRARILRASGEVHVTNMELYFDLVYVFAFTQLSEYLYEHLNLVGAVHTTVLLLALWWAWNDTAWATGWIDPESTPVVTLMAALMGTSVLAASAVLTAFGHRGLEFAIVIVAMQFLRGGFMLSAFARGTPLRAHYWRVLGWAVITALLWIAGGVVHDSGTRTVLWGIAAVVGLLAPALHFWLPGAGATRDSDLTLVGGHLAERCQLLLMVAFGETILRLGEAAVESHGELASQGTFLVGFTLTFSMSMIYFLRHAKAGERVLAAAGRRTAALGVTGYTYSHTLLVASTVMVSVAIHEGIEHPGRSVDPGFAMVCIGAPIVYLLGITLWKLKLGHGRVLPTVIGAVAVLLLGLPATLFSDAVTLATVTAITVVISVWVQQDPREWGSEPFWHG